MKSARKILLLLLMALLGGGAQAAEPAQARGGRVGWARLRTPNIRWDLHSDQDPKLARFIGEKTTLNIDPTWYTVEPDVVSELCAYPFIYVKDLVRVTNASHQKNIAEYLRRGGFIFIDPCVNAFSPQMKADLIADHIRLFKRLLPETSASELPDDHPIYRSYFPVTVDELYTPDMIVRGAVKPARVGLTGIFSGERMIAVISVTGLECGWPETPQRVPGCMKVIVNSYVYAMTR